MKATITIDLDDAAELARLLTLLAGPQATGPVQERKPVPAGAPPARAWQPIPELLESDEGEPEAIKKICTKCFKEFTTSSKVRTQCDSCFFEMEAMSTQPKPVRNPSRRSDQPLGRPRRPDRPVLEGVRHGSAHSYSLGCRCDECTAVKARKAREYAQRRRARESA